MADLLDDVLAAAGGLDRWRQIASITAHARVGGTMWARRGHAGVIADTQVTVSTRYQHTVYQPFAFPESRADYRPDRVVLSRDDGTVLASRDEPRAAVLGVPPDQPWDVLHAAYFAGYAMWTYLNVPFLFTWPGVEAEELKPWPETSDWTGGRTDLWRRLRISFPPEIATHNAIQTFYYDRDLALRRHDYNADVFAGAPTAHYSAAPAHAGGLTLPTRRRVVPRRPDGTTAPGPALVAIDLDAVTVAAAEPAHQF